MANGKSLVARVGALEGKVAKFESFGKELDKVLEPHFRAQAELIDRLFILRLDEWDKRWDAKFEQKLEQKFEARLRPLRDELAIVRQGVQILLTRRR
jgi:DNA anti-recombination protein RmuC